MKTIISFLLAIIWLFPLHAITEDQPLSSLRGTVTDADSRMPLIGVNIIIAGNDPVLGTITDAKGEFRFGKLHTGRYDLEIRYIGYESKTVSNIVLIAGKESVVDAELTESMISLDEVTVKANSNKGEPLNRLAFTSARSFTVEETKRYAGSFNDPSRMAASYAGVTGDATGNNDIVIRGNSPRGLLWRLEGVEIPNPNHFSEEGATGGPISILNSTTLDNSDFLTGAFPAEYGNAYSGVFDINLRKGNNEKREYTLQAGILGFEGAAEGPIVKGSKASYLLNYRYSTLAILNSIGIKIAGDAVPEFQDLTFKVYVPTEKAGTFNFFGLGGKSNIWEKYPEWTNDFATDMGVLGLSHLYIFSPKTYLKTQVATTGSRNIWSYEEKNARDLSEPIARENYTYFTRKAQMSMNHKFNSRHRLKAGLGYSDIYFDLLHDYLSDDESGMVRAVDQDGNTGYLQAYGTWRYRIQESLTAHAGLHYMRFTLNGNYSLEPRMGLKWLFSPNQSLSAGFGIHSRLETLTNYFAESSYKAESEINPNKDLDLSKARHYVLAYQNNRIRNLMIKTELYYQDLYNIPVARDTLNSFSALNFSDGVTNEALVNKGTGTNYGIELTVEKFFSDSWYCLATTSLYQSTYKGSDMILRDTRYNGNYVFNALGGKEFTLGKGMYPWKLNASIRFTFAGGRMKTPIDLEASREADYTIRKNELAYTESYDDVLRLDCKVSFVKNRGRSTHTIELDIQNATNRLNTMYDYYNSQEDAIESVTQLGFIPGILYRVEF